MSILQEIWYDTEDGLYYIRRIYYPSLLASDLSLVPHTIPHSFSPQLSVGHNGGIPIPETLTWEDFFTIHFVEDQSRVFVPLLPSDRLPERASRLLNRNEGQNRNGGEFDLTTNNILSIMGTQNQLINISNLESFVARQQLHLQQQQHPQQQPEGWNTTRSLSNATLVWHIKSAMYSDWGTKIETEFHQRPTSEQSVLPQLGEHRLPERCNYIEWMPRPSDMAQQIVERVFDAISQPGASSLTHSTTTTVSTATTFGYLHIRRGDTIDECNTTLAHLNEYLHCTLFTRKREIYHSFSTQNVTLLLGSDERDPCYRTAVCDLITKVYGYGCVDLDELVVRAISDYVAEHYPSSSEHAEHGQRFLNNNMFVFFIANLIHWDSRISIRLEKRKRNYCPDCVDIVQHFGPQKGVSTTAVGLDTNSHDHETLVEVSSRASDVLTRYDECRNNTMMRP